MAETWVSVTEAAAAMGVHARTVERRIGRGELESRVRPDGRREVRMPEAAAACPTGAGHGVGHDAGQVVEVVTAAQEQALKLSGVVVHQATRELEVVRDELTRTRSDLKAARSSCRRGWSAAAAVLVLAAGAGVGTAWWAAGTRAKVTTAQELRRVEVEGLRRELAAAQAERDRAAQEAMNRADAVRSLSGAVVELLAASATPAPLPQTHNHTTQNPAGEALVGVSLDR